MGIRLIKKESMERCDSCGAVMTEYDYDRYGGLCKYCRSKESNQETPSSLSESGLNASIFAEPSFDAVKYGLEEISKNNSGEIEIVSGIDSDGSAQDLADKVTALHKKHPEKKYHITAIGTDSDGIEDKSEVIWSDYPEEVPADETKTTTESAPYIQRYVITGGTGPESGEETEREKIDVSGDPEQELWDMVLEEIPADYEQHLFVNNDEYDNLIDDDDIAALKNIGLDGFKKKHGIAKVTSMGYYTHPWSGMLSDLMDYRIKGVTETKEPENKTTPANEGRVTSYFVVNKNADEKAVEKIVSTLEDAILNNQTVETTANADGTVSLEIYGRMSPDDVARAMQLPGQLGTSYVDLAINIEG